MLNDLLSLFLKVIQDFTDSDIGLIFYSILIIVSLFTILRKAIYL